MSHFLNRLSVKLIAVIVLLTIVLGAVIAYEGYQEFTAVLEQQYNDSAYEVAETAKSYLNPDSFEQYLTTEETDAEHQEILARLDSLVNTTDTTLIYVAAVDTSDYQTLTYIYDSVNASTGFERYPFLYTDIGVAPEYVPDVTKIMTEGGRATEYLYYYSEESGAHTTAGLSVEDSEGNIVAIIGVEKAMTALENARMTYVQNVMGIVGIAVALFLFVYGLYLRSAITRPLSIITREAQRFAGNEVQPSDVLTSIRQKDEIGILAQAVTRMEHDICTYIENLTTVTAEKERIGAELNVATQIQADMLPRIFPAFPDREEFDVYATMNPAKEVGGDFYDFFLVDDDHLAVVIADVSGKGVPAALFMVIAKTLIKNHAQNQEAPGTVFTQTNEQLCEGNDAGLFVTGWMGVLEISTGRFVYVNAGHNPPLLKRAGGTFEWLKSRPGFVLAGMEGVRYRENTLQLEPGDRLYLYTDGVTEATNSHEELFGDERLQNALNEYMDLPVEQLLPKIKECIDAFVGDADQFDDITMLALDYRSKGETEHD